ncbi:MAG: amino acid adenylation domain-containing protein [Phycisphaerales bacterium]
MNTARVHPEGSAPGIDRPPHLSAAAEPWLLHQMIDRAADRDPTHPAMVGSSATVTYGELVERADALAAVLRDRGVRRGDRVGIFMPRVPESAVAVYGILRAGAAFVPIDPGLPVEAVRRLTDACGIQHLVVNRDMRRPLNALTEGAGPGRVQTVVGFDRPLPGLETVGWDEVDGRRGTAAAAVQTPVVGDDLAYIMFSSGSTGRPKGIMHTHRSGLAYARLSAATYDVRPDDVIGNHSPLHFDMSTFGYFTAPWAGATSVIVPEAYTKLTASLSQLIADTGITIWYSVPLALIQLLERGVLEDRDCSRVRWVLYGGEPFPVKHMDALMRRWPAARISNVYGPAEVNQCTWHHVGPFEDGQELPPTIPIGQIWDDSEGLVVDADCEPVAPGAEGELIVHSATMMRGYWDRPDLDARAFVEREDATGHPRRYYRTGDLVRADEQGALHFLGRMDRQVKIRGHRVELDEVEAGLAAHPAVEEAAVFPVRESDAARRIEAAIILRAAAEVGPEELAGFAGERMSPYAVPGRIRIVPELPRTTSGKIDRRGLQAAAEESESESAASTTATDGSGDPAVPARGATT